MLYFDLIVVFHVALDKRWYINRIVAVILTAFRMGFFRTADGWVGQWGGAKRKICHTSYNDKTCHSYTLPKEDPKNV